MLLQASFGDVPLPGITLLLVALWVGFGFWGAFIAKNKSGGGCAGFLLGLLLGPIGLIIALLLPYKPRP